MTKAEFDQILDETATSELALLHETIITSRDQLIKTLVEGNRSFKIDVLYLQVLADRARMMNKTKIIPQAELVNWLNQTNALQNKILNLLTKAKGLGVLSRVITHL